jgi:hypothetical protein
MEIQVEINHTANPSEDILKKLQTMRERSAPKIEDLGEKDENIIDEPEDQANGPLHVNSVT